MTPLERDLLDLGEHLAHGDGAGLVGAVRARAAGVRQRRRAAPAGLTRTPGRVALVAALVIAVVLLVPPTRRAVARLLGIGGVQLRPVPTTVLGPGTTNPPTATVPGAPPTPSTVSTPPPAGAASTSTATVAGADAPIPRVGFAVRTAGREWGPLRRVDTDDRVPGGLVALVYDRFTVVELASGENDYPIVAKLLPPGVEVIFTKVDGVDAVWLQGAHEIAYEAPDGTVREDTVRRAGAVLLWAKGNVTYRIEGFDKEADAQLVAASLR